MLAEPEWVRIKGADEPVPARRLVGIAPRDGLVGRAEASLVRTEQTIHQIADEVRSDLKGSS